MQAELIRITRYPHMNGVIKVKLFLQEKQSLIMMNILQITVILLLFWLDGYKSKQMIFYVLFLSIFILTCYLVVNYITRRNFYARLQCAQTTLDESIQKYDNVPISEALERLLKLQYQLYMEKIGTIEAKKEEHFMFMDRWVHQMKTPLSVIELTAQDLDEPESSNIREETEQMKTGLNTVLYMARLRTIEKDFRIQPVLLEKVIRDVNVDLKRFYIRNEVYPKLEIQRANITVESDEKWLFFMLSQLIYNAVKYSKGHSKQINISLFEQQEAAIIEIEDFGIGIPPNDMRRIFDAFYTGQNGRLYRESTGMGLFLVKEVTQYLQHNVEVESEVGKGSRFRIIFSPTQNLTKM